MRNEIRYPLRFFEPIEAERPSAEKIVWIDDEIFFLKYLCRECGYRYTLCIALCEIRDTRFAETPVAMIRKEDQKCPHIWGYWPEKDVFLLKFAAMSEIHALQEKFSSIDLTESSAKGHKN